MESWGKNSSELENSISGWMGSWQLGTGTVTGTGTASQARWAAKASKHLWQLGSWDSQQLLRQEARGRSHEMSTFDLLLLLLPFVIVRSIFEYSHAAWIRIPCVTFHTKA